MDFPSGSVVENLPANSWVKKIPWRRKWHPTPVFLPKTLHGQSLEGYSPWGCKKVRHDLVTKQQLHQQLFFKKKKRKLQDGDSRSPNPLGNLSELDAPRACTDHTPRSRMWVDSCLCLWSQIYW